MDSSTAYVLEEPLEQKFDLANDDYSSSKKPIKDSLTKPICSLQDCYCSSYSIEQLLAAPLLPYKYKDHKKQIVIWAIDRDEADEIYKHYISDALKNNHAGMHPQKMIDKKTYIQK